MIHRFSKFCSNKGKQNMRRCCIDLQTRFFHSSKIAVNFYLRSGTFTHARHDASKRKGLQKMEGKKNFYELFFRYGTP